MPIANYTTQVSAMKSVGEIQGMLVAHKARAIIIEYKDGQPSALSFVIPVKEGEVPFRLPANVDKVTTLLLKLRSRKPERWQSDYEQKMAKITEQANRVAWRVLKDWVRAQMAIIETEMVKPEEVFLPYLIMPNKKSLYESIQDKGFYLTEGKG